VTILYVSSEGIFFESKMNKHLPLDY